MSFLAIAKARYSCRKYDASRMVEEEKIEAVLEAGLLSPSACNSQPYHITVCKGETAQRVAKLAQGPGFNRFASDAPVILVISEKPYNRTAAIGAKLKKNDYRSIDIGILAAYLTAEATAQGLGSCILGWLDSAKIMEACELDGEVRLLVTLGYALDQETEKKRKQKSDLIRYL